MRILDLSPSKKSDSEIESDASSDKESEIKLSRKISPVYQ